MEYGGLFPLLEGKKSSHSTNVDAYLLGQGTPSVIISGLTEGEIPLARVHIFHNFEIPGETCSRRERRKEKGGGGGGCRACVDS